MVTRKHCMGNAFSERVNLLSQSSFRMKAGKIYREKRYVAETDEDQTDSLTLLQKIKNPTVWQVNLRKLERKGCMIDWAAAKYPSGRALKWNDSRNTAEKKIQGRESDLGLNVQTQADGHITELAF